jgi:hypothetical protein
LHRKGDSKMIKTIKTIKYGELEIRYNPNFTRDRVIDIVEDAEGNVYEIKENLNGKLVALLIAEDGQ